MISKALVKQFQIVAGKENVMTDQADRFFSGDFVINALSGKIYCSSKGRAAVGPAFGMGARRVHLFQQ